MSIPRLGAWKYGSACRFEISFADLDTLKKSLSCELQQVKCSHRIEALARGMGWTTNAAMRVALSKGAQTVEMNGAAFTEFLEARGYREIDAGVLETALRQVLKVVAPRS